MLVSKVARMPRLWIARPQRDCTLKRRHRLSRPTHLHKHVPEVLAYSGVVGPQLECVFKRRHGLFELLGLYQRQP